MWHRILFFSMLSVASFASTLAAQEVSDSRRAKILEIAKSYAEFRWRAGKENIFHQKDAKGVQVDTPDHEFVDGGWHPDKENVGMPYKWGGFSSLEGFREGIAAGQFAGHLPTSRAAGASSQAVGVDCSGFVSRCWELPVKQSTRSLGELCYELEGYHELQPGDILNRYDAHVMLFKAYEDEAKTRMIVVEAVTPCVLERSHSVEDLKKSGYIPLRYRPLDPAWRKNAMSFDDPNGIMEGAHAFEAEGEALEDSEVLDDLMAPIASAEVGQWVRYRQSGDGEETSLVTRGLRRNAKGDLVLQYRLTENGEFLESEESHDPTESLLLSWMKAMAPESKVSALEVETCQVQEGTYRIGEADFPSLKIETRLRVAMPNGRSELNLRVAVNGYYSELVPLRGFLRVDFRIEVMGDDGPVQVVESRYDLDAYRSGAS